MAKQGLIIEVFLSFGGRIADQRCYDFTEMVGVNGCRDYKIPGI
tara:strand:+ start:1302 stop:1433 length:132 start_codon:yes stop_codon:yes gene_type:complete